jgi:hypothetical protein
VLYKITKAVGIRIQSQALLMLGGPGSVWGVDNVGTYGTIVQQDFRRHRLFIWEKTYYKTW